MAGQATNSGEKIALDAMNGRATQTARTLYIALCTADPGETATPLSISEYAATGYSRQVVAFTDPTTLGTCSNTALLTFGPFTAGTGATISHVALVSSSSGTSGDCPYYWSLDTSRTPGTGDTSSFAIGALVMSQT